MNVKYSLHNIIFEWDSQKAATNLRKHSITFELACEAFLTRLYAISMMKQSMANYEKPLWG
jgi:uncharacterized DUF497 family protein